MTHTYATLAQIKANINTEKTSEDTRLLEYAQYVSERIDLEQNSDYPFFLPYKVSEDVLIDPTQVNSRQNTLRLTSYWLELSGVTQNGQARVVGTDVFAYPPGVLPIHTLRLTSYSNRWYDAPCDGCNSTPLTTTLAGIRGFRRRGASWKQVGTLAANIDASVTTITVNNLAAAAITGESDSNFSAGCLFRIGDEYLFKLYSASSNTVERGVHGTTAAAHTQGDAVEVFQVEPVIVRVVARQAGLLLMRRGAYDTRSANDLGTPIVYPADMLAEVYAVLQEFAYA